MTFKDGDRVRILRYGEEYFHALEPGDICEVLEVDHGDGTVYIQSDSHATYVYAEDVELVPDELEFPALAEQIAALTPEEFYRLMREAFGGK